ncbi:DUF475 domain-containing protein [Deinococcus ruber]|uniref:DUF475 domain-containing protein n=1 Tax=Deinococcus ruber TaxID=1848197 RepID=A0A918KVC0_9DEIO|nr:DUF475 domain-containing protein [Deinococcus ruber]GGR34973.1 hypothetical protein GCM10008957_51220 [Deinococcus ruber]
MQNFVKNFGFALGVTVFALLVAVTDGYFRNGHSLSAAGSALIIAVLLGILELSLSFDNAVVNAGVLRNMDPKWQRRFLTWGIIIAVFGMRFIFPIVIVAITAGLGFFEVIREAFGSPETYSKHLEEARVPINAFGSAFLLLVFLKYLIDPEKDEHWFGWLEEKLARVGKLDTIQVVITGVLLLLAVHYLVAPDMQYTALIAGVVGIIVYLLVDALGNLFDPNDIAMRAGAAGLASFLYLEVLDASFSLDGVIGAFALTKDIVIIAAGLTIGAIFVRSITVSLVRSGTLDTYRYLEHGAHYGIGALAVIMMLSMSDNVHIPEVVTGLIGAGFIALAIWTSMRANRRETLQQQN